MDDRLYNSLLDQIAALPTVDAHEHLHAEEMRVARQVDVFLLFHQYLVAQLICAGMPQEEAQALEAEEVPLDQKWAYLSPYLDHVRHNAVARPAFEAIKYYFGEDDLTADNYEKLSEQMRAHNQPGLFEKCLRQDCNIDTVLNQNRTMWQTDLFKPILFETRFIGGPGREGFEAVMVEAAEPEKWGMCEDAVGGVVRPTLLSGGTPGGPTGVSGVPDTIDGFIEVMEGLLAVRAGEGMVGVKSIGFERVAVEKAQAQTAYQHLRAGKADGGDLCALASYLRDQMWEACGRLNLVAVVHTGVWAGNYATHETIRPTNVLAMALAHRNTRFDLFHAGTPWPADAALTARASHNIWLNMCWSPLLSPALAEHALDLFIDGVPANRLIGFGGDYWWNIENVYGALLQAREVYARVLARRVHSGAFDEREALRLAQLWLHDNPREAYGVQ
jgi:hypothetical protein